MVYSAVEPPGAKGKFVWWVSLPAMFGIFAALVLAVIGLQDLSRKDARHRPSQAFPETTDLAHRWGRKFFRGAGILAAICCIISVGLALASGMPVLMGVAMGLSLLIIVAIVAGILYLMVVGLRVAYLTAARRFGRGGPTIPCLEVQAKVSATGGAGVRSRPETASDQVQAAPTTRHSTDITQE
jgi:hypothetical protein